MRVNNKAFNKSVQDVIMNNPPELSRHCLEDVGIYNVNLVKVRNVDEYDIIVSIENIESSMLNIRDLIEYVCDIHNIKYRKILIEI